MFEIPISIISFAFAFLVLVLIVKVFGKKNYDD